MGILSNLYVILVASAAFIRSFGQLQVRINTNLGGCVGGEICVYQPAVQVVYAGTGQLATTYQGIVYAQVAATPSGREKLYVGECSNLGCPRSVFGTMASAPFENGIAKLSNLMLKTAGTYKITYYGQSSSGRTFASVTSLPLTVVTGSLYQMVFTVYIGTASGGLPFSPNPIVALADRGGNLITSHSGGFVTATLRGPTGHEILRPQGSTVVPFFGGIASFNGLHVNEAGYPYYVIFNASIGIPLPLLTTSPFPVAVGVAAGLNFVNGSRISNAPVRAGEFFTVAPRLYIVDAGGNTVTSDTRSGVTVKIINNPSGGQLLPARSLFAVASLGIVTFSSMRIDKAGPGYRLQFTLSSYSGLTGLFTPTSVQTLSEKFNVVTGPPRMLGTRVQPDFAWAGGQPFKTQPVIQLMDYGGNVLEQDYSSVLSCTMISSLSTRSKVMISTTGQAFSTYVSTVDIDTASGTYGAGQVIRFFVNFNYEVWVEPNSRPYLVLNSLTASKANVRAIFTGTYNRVKTLIFTYFVNIGDRSKLLDFNGQLALKTNNSWIRDGDNHTVSLVLPSASISSLVTIVIDTDPPILKGMAMQLPAGEYGAGEQLVFNLTYNYPVVVRGHPYFFLNSGDSNSNQPIANYTHQSDNLKTLYFVYRVRQGDASTQLSVYNKDIQLPHADCVIWRNATTLIGRASLVLGGVAAAFRKNQPTVIDTTPPILDTTYGVQTTHPNGIYYPGEIIYFTIRFTKPVVLYGIDINLLFQCGSPGRSLVGYAGIVGLMSDSKTVKFKFEAFTGANTSRLDIVAGGRALLVPAYPTYIRRKSAVPTTDVDTNTTAVYRSGRSLRNTANIQLYGFNPTIKSVKFLSAYPNKTKALYPDDYALIAVSFSTRVVATCSPVLVIDAGLFREAVYYSGNHTDRFIFKYTVQMGDFGFTLNYRYDPTALCVTSGCPYLTKCKILANSTIPTTPLDFTTMPYYNGNRFTGVFLANYSIKPKNFYRNTSIVSISTQLAAGTYGAGTIVYYDVYFQDEVFYTSLSQSISQYPSLYLNIGKFANFSGGSGSHKLTFSYITKNNDNTPTGKYLSPAVLPGTRSALRCFKSEYCSLSNAIGMAPNMSTQNVIVSSGVIINSRRPKILAVWSNKATSPYDGVYGVGEIIYIYMTFDQPIMMTGLSPRLKINATSVPAGNVSSSNLRYAFLEPGTSTTTMLVFKYTVTFGDQTLNLGFLGPELDRNGGLCIIYREAIIPSTQIDYTLPTPGPLARQGNIIRLFTTSPPSVIGVFAVSPSKRYMTGDRVIIRVDFDRYIMSSGLAYLHLNVGDHFALATFVGINSTVRSSLIPTSATKSMFFLYTVKAGDFTPNLDYVDQFSFFAGKDIVNGPGMIYAASSIPSQAAVLDLPHVGHAGSISYSSDIYIDGRTAYETSLQIVTPDGTYGIFDKIYLQLNFSKSVVVKGVPSILLAAGPVDRPANYVSGSGTNSLLFLYVPQPGDFTFNLDYAINRAALSSAATSFQLNGGQILVKSANSSQPVYVKLNPVGGVLSGTLTVNASAGLFTYLDVSIYTRGPDYTLRYSAAPHGSAATLTTTQNLFVSFSNEYDLAPHEGLPNDLVGWAVDISGDITVTGAPKSNVSVTTIQTVTTTGPYTPPVQEVQIVGTHIVPQPAIQSFHSTAAVGETVGGFFRVFYGLSGPTRPIPVNADEDMILAIFEYDLAVLGTINVSRVPYIYCACQNAFTWTITMTNINIGVAQTLSFDSTLMTGVEATISPATIIQSPARLSGGFALQAFGKQSNVISCTAGVVEITNAITGLGLIVTDVFISPTDVSLAKQWSITLGAYNDSYNIPLLGVNYTMLGGGVASAWVEIARPGVYGPNGIAGGFQLEFRGNITGMLSASATAEQIKAALQSLPTINKVNVHRSDASMINGYTWTIEFIEVRTFTARGYVVDKIDNVEPLIAHSHLIGTNTSIIVNSVYNWGQSLNSTGIVRQGTYGASAGAVYVFQRDEESFVQVSTIRGEDTNELDQFGHSVNINGDLLIVGAIGADLNGKPEKQSIFCSATSGTFQLSFRGWQSEPIGANASRLEVINAIVALDQSTMTKLVSITAITVDDWGPGGLCDNNTAVITFYTPQWGDANLFGVDNGPHLELLQVENSLLQYANGVNGVVKVAEVQVGTQQNQGMDANPQQVGSVYIFRAHYKCFTNESVCFKKQWQQEAQFYPVSTQPEQYGHSVAIGATSAVVGAPGGQLGTVYVYTYNSVSMRWSLLQHIVNFELTPGAQFGYSIGLSEDENFLVIGMPHQMEDKGQCLLYKRNSPTSFFTLSQQLLPNRIKYPILPGDMFGSAVAISANAVVVSAKQKSMAAIYRGRTPNPVSDKTGAVFIFQRATAVADFAFLEALTPSNVQREDQFGWDIDIDGDVLVVSAVQEFTGTWGPNAAIVQIQTACNYGGRSLGGSFKLKWESTNASGVWGFKTTRSIPHDVTAANLGVIIEHDLQSGQVLVSRSDVDIYNGGYIWMVTFLGRSVQGIDVALPIPEFSGLLGPNASATTKWIFTSPPLTRSNTHVFQRDQSTGRFSEQLFVTPFAFQANDQCGWQVAVSENYVTVGCPNRDNAVPNNNTGGAAVYYLSLLHIEFASYNYAVSEGKPISLTVQRTSTSALAVDVLYYATSVDRNAQLTMQTLLRNLYGVTNTTIAFPDTVADAVGVAGTAMGRSQYYGSNHNESLWIDGMYDYRGLADYVPINYPLAYLVEYINSSFTVVTNPDTILEKPDENVTIALNAPGIWPSVLGRLYSIVTISDDDDGFAANTTQFDKLYHSPLQYGGQSGSSVAVNEALGVLFSGAPFAEANGIFQAGTVTQYQLVNEKWVQWRDFHSPRPSPVGNFGDAIIITKLVNRKIAILAIGEPTTSEVHIYNSMGSSLGIDWAWEATLSVPQANTPQARFGALGTIGQDNDLLVVGAPGLEAVFVFIRAFNNITMAYEWTPGSLLRSSDFDYDIIYSAVSIHTQEFGKSVAVSKRTFAVGSPYADYQRLGTHLVEIDWNTMGTDIYATGVGKAYVFYSSPCQQVIKIYAAGQLSNGSFVLSYMNRGVTLQTKQIRFNAQAGTVAAALNALPNMNEVAVTYSQAFVTNSSKAEFLYSWTVTFLYDWVEPTTLVALWRGFGCSFCAEFSVPTVKGYQQIEVVKTHYMGNITEQQALGPSATSKRAGDRFGWTIALDNNQLLVGAINSAAMTSTTWDFEAGTLAGWSASGTAFQYQPTYGDNPSLRPQYPGIKDLSLAAKVVSSRMTGKYFVGTYEKRPGSDTDFQIPHPAYPQGSIQGDSPQGTLTSDPFTILGTKISFLLGGGCDYNSIYVELMVDGISMEKVTGKCDERMDWYSFDVSALSNRTARIQIVDASSGSWGHINVDQFTFDWSVDGARYLNANGKVHTTGMGETIQSGAVYAFLRRDKASINLCDYKNAVNCSWVQETIMVASDKRAQIQFGASIAVNDTAGVVVIGAPGAECTGLFKELPTVYPYQNISGGSNMFAFQFPLNMDTMSLWESDPTFAASASAAYGILQLQKRANFAPDYRSHTQCGAAYVYVKEHAAVAANGLVTRAQHWYPYEKAKLQASDLFAKSYFGSSVAISGAILAVGAVGAVQNAGAVYQFNSQFASLSFSAKEFYAFEGYDQHAVVTILRDLKIYSGEMVVEYATSSITATGVDAVKFAECSVMSTADRGPAYCGDYQQTRGYLVIPAGANSGGFSVPIVDDLCYERFLKFIQVTISVPGANALQGEFMSAKVRIDDNDYLELPCAQFN